MQDTDPDCTAIWRYSVKDAETAQWQHFADWDGLIAYLRGEFGAPGEQARSEEKMA